MLELLILTTALAIFIAFVHFLKTPRLADRVLAFDTMGILAIALLVLLSVTEKSALYLDVAFVFALIGFIGTIVFARFNLVKKGDDV